MNEEIIDQPGQAEDFDARVEEALKTATPEKCYVLVFKLTDGGNLEDQGRVPWAKFDESVEAAKRGGGAFKFQVRIEGRRGSIAEKTYYAAVQSPRPAATLPPVQPQAMPVYQPHLSEHPGVMEMMRLIIDQHRAESQESRREAAELRRELRELMQKQSNFGDVVEMVEKAKKLAAPQSENAQILSDLAPVIKGVGETIISRLGPAPQRRQVVNTKPRQELAAKQAPKPAAPAKPETPTQEEASAKYIGDVLARACGSNSPAAAYAEIIADELERTGQDGLLASADREAVWEFVVGTNPRFEPHKSRVLEVIDALLAMYKEAANEPDATPESE